MNNYTQVYLAINMSALDLFVGGFTLDDMAAVADVVEETGGSALLYLDLNHRVIAKYEDEKWNIQWIRGMVTLTYSHHYLPYAFMSFSYNYGRDINRGYRMPRVKLQTPSITVYSPLGSPSPLVL